MVLEDSQVSVAALRSNISNATFRITQTHMYLWETVAALKSSNAAFRKSRL